MYCVCLRWLFTFYQHKSACFFTTFWNNEIFVALFQPPYANLIFRFYYIIVVWLSKIGAVFCISMPSVGVYHYSIEDLVLPREYTCYLCNNILNLSLGPLLLNKYKMSPHSFWIPILDPYLIHTVEGNLHQLRLAVFPIICKVFYGGGLAGFLNHHPQYQLTGGPRNRYKQAQGPKIAFIGVK